MNRKSDKNNKDNSHTPVNVTVVESVKDTEEDQSECSNHGTDDRKDIEDGLPFSDRSGDTALMTQVTLSESAKDVKSRGEAAEDDEECMVGSANVGNENDSSFLDFVLDEVVVCPQTEQANDTGCPEGEGEDWQEPVETVDSDHLDVLAKSWSVGCGGLV